MRILVVEDERTVAAALRRGLQAEGFEVDLADNGDDGLWMATEGSYDLIILDIMLPKRNGYQVCREIRDSGSWVPVLMLTAKDGEYDEAEALDTGADDYLSKPFSFVVLVARINALLRRGGSQPGDGLSVGDLRIDPIGHRCWRGEEPISLTAREMAVLGFMMRRAGSVVSKSAILDNVWTYDFSGDPNIIEVYMGRLRRKIDGPFGTRTITTVRGVGYRLEVET
ncbi:MAG: response regulator transcription factor [Acidobacteria bacterium]|nr:response regulator transcription factor [Acidobacteriota bacterium]